MIFSLAEISFLVDSELPFGNEALNAKFSNFLSNELSIDIINVKHHLIKQPLYYKNLIRNGRKLFETNGFLVIQNGEELIFYKKVELPNTAVVGEYAIFSKDFKKADIYHIDDSLFQKGRFWSITGSVSDQILLSYLLAERSGCIFHSSGIVYENNGLIFIGNSGAGKSSIIQQFKKETPLLSEDRIIVRKIGNKFMLYGTWFHDFSNRLTIPGGVPLKALFILKQSDKNCIERIKNTSTIVTKLLTCIIRPLETEKWWGLTLNFLSELAEKVPVHYLFFDMSGNITHEIDKLYKFKTK